MRRRNFIAGIGLLGLVGVGVATTNDGGSVTLSDTEGSVESPTPTPEGETLLLGEPDSVAGTVVEPGVIEYDAAVTRAAWTAASEQQRAVLELTMADPAPRSFRLHRPDGKRVGATVEKPRAGSTVALDIGLPITHPGTWKLVVEADGTVVSLPVPANPEFEIRDYGLRGETINAAIVNPTDAPHYIEELTLSHSQRGYVEFYDVGKVLLPAESYQFETEYPFEFYQDVRLRVSDGEVDIAEQTKSFA